MWIAAILILFWQAAAAHAGPLEDCEQVRDIDRRIHGCTVRIRQYPRDATAFFHRGAAYLGKGDLERAIADNTRAILIDPGYAAAYYHRGMAYQRKEQYDQAIADFGQAVAINPRHGPVFGARARTYLWVDQPTLALRDAERAVFIDPFDAEFLDTRAHVYEALSRTQDAVADYRRVLAIDPAAKSAIDGLGRLGVSLAAVNAPAGSAPKAESNANRRYYAARPRNSPEEIECERARHADPVGHDAGYPCWAREAFSRNRIRGR